MIGNATIYGVINTIFRNNFGFSNGIFNEKQDK